MGLDMAGPYIYIYIFFQKSQKQKKGKRMNMYNNRLEHAFSLDLAHPPLLLFLHHLLFEYVQ